ncbi:4-(cytidine 5'-diphospho)-2-C-methyl-D-erythritol kinase [Oleiharenicola sp. Vm1]|uniref:4-(cytidine 5'-diphospho)-2-C-methyl-D-erythritol kinase n=1 Tax=Oleiharenicola sp. Vm1 TaxID=3398393 RepID=UPI0039F5B915
MSVTVFSPAKINLFLAITGRRADGFHDLVSVVAPLEFGDELVTEPAEGGRFTLACDAADVPTDATNLIIQAAQLFAATTGWTGGARFRLTKRIPMGAGLGGGSSNAVAALRALDQLAGGIAGAASLEAMAARLGSDCVLFLRAAPVVMRGRGERVEDLPPAAAARLRGRRVLVFKPSFGIATPGPTGAWSRAGRITCRRRRPRRGSRRGSRAARRRRRSCSTTWSRRRSRNSSHCPCCCRNCATRSASRRG